MLEDLGRSGKCDWFLVSQLRAAFLQFHLAQDAAASARVGAVQLAAQVEQAAMLEAAGAKDLLAADRISRQVEAFCALAEFCDQIEQRTRACTCEAGRAAGPLKSYWLWSKEADDAKA